MYKENSTRGASRLMPKKYKRDVLMQVWLESRHLATLLKWLGQEGKFVRFRSEIVRYTVEAVVEHLVESGVVEMVDRAEDAVELLDSRFGVENNPAGRGLKNRMHNLVLDGEKVGDYCVLKEEDSGDVFDRAFLRARKEEERKIKEETAAIVRRGKVDEDGVITAVGSSSSVVEEEDMKRFEDRERKRKEVMEVGKARVRNVEKVRKIDDKLLELEVKLDGLRRRKENSEKDEEERDDIGKDSEGVGEEC